MVPGIRHYGSVDLRNVSKSYFGVLEIALGYAKVDPRRSQDGFRGLRWPKRGGARLKEVQESTQDGPNATTKNRKTIKESYYFDVPGIVRKRLRLLLDFLGTKILHRNLQLRRKRAKATPERHPNWPKVARETSLIAPPDAHHRVRGTRAPTGSRSRAPF